MRETDVSAKRLLEHDKRVANGAYVAKLPLDAVPESGVDYLGVVHDAIDGRSCVEASNTGVE